VKLEISRTGIFSFLNRAAVPPVALKRACERGNTGFIGDGDERAGDFHLDKNLTADHADSADNIMRSVIPSRRDGEDLTTCSGVHGLLSVINTELGDPSLRSG